MPKAGAVCVAVCEVPGGEGNMSCAIMLRTRVRQVAGFNPNYLKCCSVTSFATEAAARVLAAVLSLASEWDSDTPYLKPLGETPLILILIFVMGCCRSLHLAAR